MILAKSLVTDRPVVIFFSQGHGTFHWSGACKGSNNQGTCYRGGKKGCLQVSRMLFSCLKASGKCSLCSSANVT